MTDSLIESRDIWKRIEGRAEFCRNALKHASAGSRLNTWDETILDLSEAVLQLKNEISVLRQQGVTKETPGTE